MVDIYRKDNDDDALFELAQQYDEAKEYEKSLPIYAELANKGCEKAMKRLGELYYRGWGCEKDEEKALDLYRQAAQKGDEEAVRMLEILQPFLVDESQLIDKLTDKLIEVAQKPNMRKEFSVTFDAGGSHSFTVSLYKNDPPMYQMEQYFMAAYYVEVFEWVASSDYIPYGLFGMAIDRFLIWLNQVDQINMAKKLHLRYHQIMMEVYSKVGSDKGVETHRSRFETWKQQDPKPYHVTKGTFDYWYAKAEKRDWVAMIALSVWYRLGAGVRGNTRLSEFWKQMAQSNYHYYKPNGRPFEEEYAEIEAIWAGKDANELFQPTKNIRVCYTESQ